MDNLTQYEKKLQDVEVGESLIRQILAVKSSTDIGQDMLVHCKDIIGKLLKEEKLYVEECKNNLSEQLVQADKIHNKHNLPLKDQDNSISTRWETSAKNKKGLAIKNGLYEAVRFRLESQGFLVGPKGSAFGAIFPARDWKRYKIIEKHGMKKITDNLVKYYCLLGDDYKALTRMFLRSKNEWAKTPEYLQAIGCLCISWVVMKYKKNKMYIPVLGISGLVETERDEKYYSIYCRHLALPTEEKDEQKTKIKNKNKKIYESPFEDIDELINNKKIKIINESNVDRRKLLRYQLSLLINRKKEMDIAEGAVKHEHLKLELNQNYETMIQRTNQAAIEYRARLQLGLRTPSRQALLSYVSFREEAGSDDLKSGTLQKSKHGVDLSLCHWHSLNCAEPAALMAASSLLCEGVDVHMCFPYEGIQTQGSGLNRPKETCPWCAAVELGFRSVLCDPSGPQGKLKTGKWDWEYTKIRSNEPTSVLPTNEAFNARDDENYIMQQTSKTLSGRLVKNKDLQEIAYTPLTITKIGRIRSMYHVLGLLDPDVIAEERNLFGNVSCLNPQIFSWEAL